MHDITPAQTPLWQLLENTIRVTLAGYAYQEIRMPVVEKTELFKRSIGEVTDIVEKEMYTFEDRNGDSLTLRPEGTAGCVRAGIENGLLFNQIQRFWYIGPMFRHERPQKGRYRQFHQVGVETYGMDGAAIEAELILMGASIWRKLGLGDIQLQINTLGTSEERLAYRDVLVNYFQQHESLLDEDSQRRLQSNPLRILDSKNPEMQDMIESAPRLMDHLGDDSRLHFERLQFLLDEAGQAYQVNTRLVRGLDYYCHTVFEWVTDKLGAQGTVCAGGRYDGLVAQLGGKPTYACGFAMGEERLVSLLEDAGIKNPETEPHVYMVNIGEKAEACALGLLEKLRLQHPEIRFLQNCGGGSFKAQMKRADKSGAAVALILADRELDTNEVTIKTLRADNEQKTVAIENVSATLATLIN